MKSTTRKATFALAVVSFAASHTARCGPLPQGNPQGARPSNRPAQAQVMLAPAPVGVGKLPARQPLPADARKPDRILRMGHTRPVQALAFSPDGRWLASGGYDRNVIVWNLSSGREEFRLEAYKGKAAPQQQGMNKEAVSGLAFNPDGTRLVSVEVSGVVRVWDLGARKPLFAIHPHRVHYYGGSVAYSADGKTLLIPVERRVKDGTETAIGIYDGETGKSLRTIPTPWTALSTLVPTKDGRLIASGSVGAEDDDDPNGSVQIFDLASGEAGKTYPVLASAISTDGRWMASFDDSGVYHAVLWNLSDGRKEHDLAPQNANRVVFRPDGEEAAITYGNSNAIDFVSTATGAVTKSLPGGGYGLGTAAYSPDGKLLAAGSYSFGTIRVWDVASMKERLTLYGQSPVQSVAFSPDGKLLAATSGELRIWDVATGGEVATLADAPVNRAAFSADGKWLAANPGGQFPGKTLKIWNTQTWKEAGSFMQESGFPYMWFAFSEAKSAPAKIGNAWSQRFASGGESHILWASSLAMAVSPDGKWLAQPAGGTGTVEIWDAATGQKLQSIPAHKMAVGRVAFSRDGRCLVTVGQDNNPMMVQGQPGVMVSYPRVSVWDTATWKLEFAVTFPSSGGPGADISGHGKWMAVTTGGGATQLFDLEQKKSVGVFDSPDAWPGNLAISPDGAVLVQGAQEGIRLWKLPSSKATPD